LADHHLNCRRHQITEVDEKPIDPAQRVSRSFFASGNTSQERRTPHGQSLVQVTQSYWVLTVCAIKALPPTGVLHSPLEGGLYRGRIALA